jgi:hypothetical protein
VRTSCCGERSLKRQATTLFHTLHPPFVHYCLQASAYISEEQVADFWKDCCGSGGQVDTGSSSTAADIAAGKSQVYMSTTLADLNRKAAGVLYAIRMMFAAGWSCAARGITDPARAALVLLGAMSTFTGIHLDWTEAFNVAFAVGSNVPADAVLAVWVFIAPWAIQAADVWLKQQGRLYPNGLASVQRVHLKGKLLDRFAKLFNAFRPGSVVFVEQHARDVVYVPPGWAHQVTNLQPCLKVAWDVYVPQHFASYALLHSTIAAPLFQNAMPEDYMAFNRVAEEVLKGV